VPVEAATFPFALYAADTAATLARRLARGDRWWDAHREHAYQRLVDAGWSHAATTGFVALTVAACAALGAVSLVAPAGGRVLAAGGLLAVLAGYLALPARVEARHAGAARPTARVAGL
jgi:hypothetical protein